MKKTIVLFLKRHLGIETKSYKKAWRSYSAYMQNRLDLEHQWNKPIK